jgi:thiol-disulfide isomerase/thioredoxin
MEKYFGMLFLFLALYMGGAVIASSQDRNFSMVDKCLEKRKHFQSMSYVMELEHKFFSNEDTLKQIANVELVRKQDDSLFGGVCCIDLDSIWFGYDGTNLIKALPQMGTIEMANAEQNQGLYIKSTWIDNFMDYGFLKLSNSLKEYLQDETAEVRFLDTLIGEWPCLGIYFKLPDQDGIYDQTIFIGIDTIEYYFRSKMYSAYFQENQQYTIWNYRQVQYGNKLNIGKLDEANLSKFNIVTELTHDTSYLIQELVFDFGALTGNVLIKNEDFRMKDVDAKYIILDFWYTSCYPCIKSIPAVNEIYHSYKDKDVVVYGVNPLDDAHKDKARIEKFLKNNPMGYETIMVDRSIGDSVCADGYPTFIILDQDYKVVYKESGYKEYLYREVSTFLDEALKQSK